MCAADDLSRHHFQMQFSCLAVQQSQGSVLSDCHTLPDSTNGRITDSKTLSVRVRLHALHVRSSCGECVPCQVISVLSGLIRWQVLDMLKTSNGSHRINMYGGRTLLMRWYAVCPVFMRSASCSYPACIR